MYTLNIAQLSEGMVLAHPVYCPSTKKLLLNSGTKLTNSLINLLYSRNIETVVVADKYTLDINPVDVTIKELKYLIETKIEKITPSRQEANTSDIMVEIAKKTKALALEIIDNKDILELCVEMRVLNKNLLFEHSIQTFVLSLLVAGSMNLPEGEIYKIGLAALLHDLGLREMPHLLGRKQFLKQEEKLWQEHTTYGYYFAKEYGLDDDVSKMILYHHELWNGEGYPKKLRGTEIPLGSRIIAVCETYDRLIRFEGHEDYQAIEYLYGSCNRIFDSNVVLAFTQNLAVYPLGSLVRLSTGEVGVVVNVRQNLGPRPVVRVFFNRVNRPLTCPKDIDLGKERTIFIKEIL